MFLEPFAGPYLKLERARHHLRELHATIQEFQARAIPEFVKTDREVNPWELRLSESVPPVIALQVGDIAHSLRSALDVMLCDIALVRGVGLSDMVYPFAADEAAFRGMLARPNKNAPFKKLGDDIVAMIEQSQPFKGGDSLLRQLHDLNNQDKHRTVVPTVTFASTTANMNEEFNNPNSPMHIPGTFVLTVGGMLVGLDIDTPLIDLFPGWDPRKTYTLNPKTMRICFPGNYVIRGEVSQAMQISSILRRSWSIVFAR